MTGWWTSLPVFLRYVILTWAILLLILFGYFGFVLFQKLLNKRIRCERTSKQAQVQEVDPSVL
jgi:hypothetical protein